MGKGKLTIEEGEGEAPTKKIQKERKSKMPKSLSMIDNYDESEDEQVRVAKEVQAEREERAHTKLSHLAICFPDSILEIPQTSPLRAYFISEIARIASIFKVD